MVDGIQCAVPFCKMLDFAGFKHSNAALHIIGSGFKPNGKQTARRSIRGTRVGATRGEKKRVKMRLRLYFL